MTKERWQMMERKLVTLSSIIYQLKNMHTIHLHHLNFFAFHGVHEEERVTGNNFELNIDVDFTNEQPITDLQQTINYVTIYEIVKERMAVPTSLLETLAEDLATKIYLLDKRIKKITICIKKLSAPINNFSGVVGVSYQKEYPHSMNKN